MSYGDAIGAALLAAACGLAACGPVCGTDHRWAVKTGTDPGASAVDLATSATTTIADLAHQAVPASLPETTREPPVETQTFRLTDVRLIEAKESDDMDFHLVLSDGAGHTMIAEVPDPSCVGAGSPWGGRIAAARSVVQSRLKPTTTPATTDQVVSVMGVAFFDAVHGQDGVAPNGIEIHPVLGICFGAGCQVP